MKILTVEIGPYKGLKVKIISETHDEASGFLCEVLENFCGWEVGDKTNFNSWKFYEND